jgi:hypothetical protein
MKNLHHKLAGENVNDRKSGPDRIKRNILSDSIKLASSRYWDQRLFHWGGPVVVLLGFSEWDSSSANISSCMQIRIVLHQKLAGENANTNRPKTWACPRTSYLDTSSSVFLVRSNDNRFSRCGRFPSATENWYYLLQSEISGRTDSLFSSRLTELLKSAMWAIDWIIWPSACWTFSPSRQLRHRLF